MKDVRLNRAQREAVEYAGGPLIVLAGPGTGKTRVIVHRIEHAVRERGVDAHAVLAVTFTVKAANELRTRLQDRLGAAGAGDAHLHTFNGLGMRLLTRFGDMLGLPPVLTMIDPAQASRLVRRIVLDHGLFRASRGEGLPRLAANLLTAFEAMANLGKTPEECRAFAAAWAARLARGPVEGSPEAHAAALAACERFRDEAEAYEHYTRLRWSRGWMTYSDQLLLPIRLLREHDGPRAILRGDYRTILVDEFQDCNPAQIELLRLLAGPRGRSTPPDVCVVGDDDQSIYGFRHADDRAFQRFEKHWPGTRVIALTENYRSGTRIMTVANAVIARAHARFAPDKAIEPPREGERTPGAVQAVRLAAEFDDAEAVASMIARDRADSGRAWSSYAVIVRTANDADRVCDALRLEHIPFDRRQDKTVLDEEGVADVMAWIEWLLNPRATWAARRVLARPPFGLAADRLVALEQRYAAQRSRAGVQTAPGADRDPGAYAPWLAAQAGDDPALARALELHARLRGEVEGVRGDEAVWRIIRAVDPAHADLLPAARRVRRAAGLIALLALVRDKQPRLEEPADLRALVAHLDELRALRALRPTGELGDADGEVVESEGDEADGRVHVLTAHASKGLEFDTVFVPRITPPNGYPRAAREDDSWDPPEGLAERLDARSDAERRLDEERRVFYVACTRAQRRLVLLAKWNKSPSRSAAHFFEELLRTPAAPLPIDALDGADVLASADDAVRRAAAGLATRETTAELAQRVRAQARLAAAAALESLQAPGADEAALSRARASLEDAAATLAAVAGLERDGTLPAWLPDPASRLRSLAERFAASVKAADPRGGVASLVRPMPAPLALSYSTIRDWGKCPRCFYLKHCLRLPEPVSMQTSVGSVLHDVLHKFFDRWRRAEADGRPVPGEADLLDAGRAAYLSMLRPGESADGEVLDQLAAQLRTAFSRLHDPRANILELEKSVRFPYALDGAVHTFEAKIDRIDQLPDGSVRIVDYKTGEPWGSLTSPKKDDLQLGVYAMALRHLLGAEVRGVAEYWVLATGQRGAIDLDDLDEKKVRAQIDTAARAMLAGDFPRKPGCMGPCALLGD